MENFTPVTGLIGGIIVGIAATLLLWFNGRIAGISGIFNGMITVRRKGDVLWRFLFILGMVAGGVSHQLGTSKNRRERPECKADGAQQPRHIK